MKFLRGNPELCLIGPARYASSGGGSVTGGKQALERGREQILNEAVRAKDENEGWEEAKVGLWEHRRSVGWGENPAWCCWACTLQSPCCRVVFTPEAFPSAHLTPVTPVLLTQHTDTHFQQIAALCEVFVTEMRSSLCWNCSEATRVGIRKSQIKSGVSKVGSQRTQRESVSGSIFSLEIDSGFSLLVS